MSNDHPPTPSGAPEERHPFFDRPPSRPATPPRSLPGEGETAPAGASDAGAGSGPGPAADRLPPRDPAEFDAWFDDEPVRPMPSPAGVPPTPYVPQYGESGYGEPGPGGSAAPGFGDGGYPGPGSGPDLGGYAGGYPADPAPGPDFPAPDFPAPDFPAAAYRDPQFPAEPGTPGVPGPSGAPVAPGAPAFPGDPVANMQPAEADAADRGASGLPTRAGRRSLIGAFGPPADLQTPMSSEAFTQEAGPGEDGDQTMTTRASIKIPGSRPIPPIVLRGQAPMGRDGEGYDGYDERGGYVDGAGIRGWDDVDDHEFGVDTPAGGTAGPGGPGSRQEAGRRTPDGPAQAKRKRRRTAIVASAAVFALLGGLYGGSLAYAGGGVPRGTSVLGVDIGGQSKSEAIRTLERGLGERATGPFKVKLGDKELTLDPPNAGLILDTRGTVDRAAERSLNPLESIPAMFGGGREVKPRTIEDPAKLAAALEQLAADAGEQQREGGISFAGGKAAAIAPQSVQVLDTPAAVAAVRDAYLARSGPVVLPTKLSKPKVTQEEVDRAMREFAGPAMSGPVTLTAGKASLKLEPATLAKYLSMEPDANGKLTPKIDTAGLQEALGNTFSAVGQKPVDATFKVENGKVVVVAHKPGQGVSGTNAAQALLGVLTKTGAARTAAVTLGPVDPEFTTAKAEALGITEVMATYTTNYPYAAYRLTNIHRAADLIDGGIVMPGETWSLNKTVGERTAENGFAKGTIINNGRFQTDFGGGVSQVATTMFNAVFFAGLKDVMHKPHSFWIDRYPAGREATVAWPSLDLKWQNDSGKPVFIDTAYTDSTITVTLLGTKKYDQIKSVSSNKYDPVAPKTVNDTGAGCVAQGPSAGFKIDVTRVFVKDGKEVRREQFHTKYDAADNIICGPAAPPAGGATPPAGGTPPPPDAG
ncbi:VanW family protein [Yinghuangia soli]|uniref:VanW family protein n=1 Tax=Yinghuangia soli TaxID=2908204 RepID=A0AA41Q7I3_9ACTN|nr:VanW family protein [Yinghuangia soli]MCF2532943.1 VanW family protein [Yinghuangia soli]